jgi:hypothetical protein
MNIVRTVISMFLLLLIGIAASGWLWAGRNLPAAQATGGRVVLTLCICAGIVGLVALWRPRPTQ